MREPHIRIRFETLPDCLHLLPHGAEGLRVSDLVKELHEALRPRSELELGRAAVGGLSGGNCIKIGLPGKLILSKRKVLWEVIFS